MTTPRRLLVVIVLAVAPSLLVDTHVLAQCTTCVGDLTGEGTRDGDDIQAFVDCLIAGAGPVPGCECADMDTDTTLDVLNDVPLLVTALLAGGPCPPASALTLTLESPLVGVTRMIEGEVCLDAPAPPGGVSVALGSLDPLIAVITPAMVFIPEGQMCGGVTVTGVDFGTTTVTADAPGFSQGTDDITVTSAIISLGIGLQIIPGQSAGLPLSISVPAPAGGVTIALDTSDPLIATVTPSVFIPAGQQIPAANPQVTGVALGSVDITATTVGFAPDTREVVVAANVITLSPTTLNVVETLTSDITVQLQVSAPVGGQSVDLTIDDPGVATVPISAFIAAGENSTDVGVTGVLTGSTTLRASHAASSIPEATATINVGAAGINLTGASIGDDLQIASSGTLTAPAPAGNLDVTLTSNDPARLLLATDPTLLGSASIMVTVGAGSSTIPTFYVQALDDSGLIGITATAPGYLGGSADFLLAPSGFAIWSPSVINTFAGATATDVQIRPHRLDPVTLETSASQNLRGGISANVNVMSSDLGVGDMTLNPVPFNGNDFFANSGFDPVGVGTATISISQPPGFDLPPNDQSIDANVSSIGITIVGTTIGDDLQVSESGTLSIPAPAGNLDVTITSNDPARLLVSDDPTAAGSASIIVTVPAGTSSLPTFHVYALDDSGTASITATAPGYGPGGASYTLTPSGFRIWSPGAINTSTGVSPTNIQLRPVRLDPVTLATSSNQNIRGGLTVNLDVFSSSPAVGTITTSPVVFNPNDFFDNTSFDPLSAGTSVISLGTPPGFETPTTNQSILATVFDQNISITGTTIGDDLQITENGSLSAPAPAGNLDVTITSADPARLLLSNDPSAAGSGSIMVTVGAGSSVIPNFFVYALDDNGTVDITASAPGYAPDDATYTLTPSGFRIWSPGSINTTTFSNPTNIQLRPVRLDPGTFATSSNQNLRGGLSVNLDVMSSDINVGTISTSPVAFNGNDFFMNTLFEPLIAGSTTVSIGTPPGFDTPTNNQSINADVTAPGITISNTTVGEDLQEVRTVSLQATPPGPVDVTITVNDPSIATISLDPLLAGTGMITVNGVTTTSVGNIYVQGRLLGSTTINVQAAGYADGNADVTVDPSGFRIWSPGSISTTTFSNPTNVQIRPVRLDPVTLNTSSNQNLRGGLSVNVDVTSSDLGVGTITASPLTFNANDFFMNTAFQPVASGSCTVDVGTPVGFDTPSNNQGINATVTAPNINLSDSTVGEDLQIIKTVTLTAAPPSPVDVVVTVDDPFFATISEDPLLAGGASITFMGVSTTNVGSFYVQGRVVGSTFITVTAPGYNNDSGNVTVDPSGFRIWSPTVINTTTFSNPTNIQIRSVRLDPVTLNTSSNQNIRGGLSVNVDITSSDPLVGVITSSPLTFDANDFFMNTTFDPDTVGVSMIDVVTPLGFDVPSNNQQITATVDTPNINISDATIGEDLQLSRSISLEAAPPIPTDITVTVDNGSIASVSTDPLTAGGTSVTFFGVTSTSVGSVYFHGLQQGMTFATLSAAGYNNGNSDITINPSGFRIWSPSAINTTAGAADTNVQIRPVMLDPVTFNTSSNQNIRGSFSVNVDVTSSDTGVGTITTSPLAFGANSFSMTTAFDPLATGTSMITVLVPVGFDTPSNNQQITATVSP